MNILGIDFTSAPSRVQPLWIAHARVEGPLGASSTTHTLVVERLERHTSFAGFDGLLGGASASTVVAIDAPFGLPLAFLDWANMEGDWERMIESILARGDRGFESLVTRFRARQPEGAKHPLRACDRLAGAASPINIIRPPVGKMFYQCATRLLRSDWRIVPCRERDRSRVAVEAYPALVARTLIGRASYKGGTDAASRLDRQRMRELLIERLLSPADDRLPRRYGVRVHLDAASLRDQATSDEDGDALDAILCCVQGAWAALRRDHAWGVPAAANPREGWIVDPATAAA